MRWKILITVLMAVTLLAATSEPSLVAHAARLEPLQNTDATVWEPPVKDGLVASPTGVYIVVLADEPLASYDGGIAGLMATSLSTTGGDKLDAYSPPSRAYLDYLAGRQRGFTDRVASNLGRGPEIVHRYRFATNGLAMRLSLDEARDVARMPGVLYVAPERLDRITTDVGPSWIGAGQVWDGTALGGEVGTYGEGVIVGVVDTGIAMAHKSFAEVDERGYEHLNPKGHYLGFCDPDNEHYDSKYKCNEKLIGVYSFLTVAPNNMDPEDDHGHGSHTASTAAGNFLTVGYYNSPTTGRMNSTFSGVAPHANIVAYDACYAVQQTGTCPGAATLMALDQAAADGVDVVNYSIETSQQSPWQNPHYQAFRRLREAGVFAAVSAGNSGAQGAATTQAIAPWTMAVAAVTHSRFFANGLANMSGGSLEPPDDLPGGALTIGFGPAPIVYAGNGQYENADGDVDDGKCLKPFAPDTFSGEIVACDRGDIARVDKGTNVLAGGAGGLVLINDLSSGDNLNADPHVLPGTQITFNNGRLLKAWLAEGEGHMAEITAGGFAPNPAGADILAQFSSRGPAIAPVGERRPGVPSTTPALFELVKPDVAMPGVDIVAAFPGGPDRLASMGGTSMAAPHAAGAAALLTAARPDWTDAEIQSAMMTTAFTGSRKEDNRRPADVFDVGSGQVDVARAAAAGLLLDITGDELDAADPSTGGDVSTLNMASMADVSCLTTCLWRRTVRNPLDRAVTWTADFAGPASLSLSVTPSEFTLSPGALQTIEIAADASALRRDAWFEARLLLEPSDADVPDAHMPIAIHTVATDMPDFVLITTDETTGDKTLEGLRFSTGSDLVVDVGGLVRGDWNSVSLKQDPTPTDRFDVDRGGADLTLLDVPAGTRRIVAEVTAADAEDVDVFLGFDTNDDKKPQANEVLTYSLNDGWHELVEIAGDGIRAGRYWVLVQNFTASKAAPDEITIVTGVVPGDDLGNLTVDAPAAVTTGDPFALDLSWNVSVLMPTDRYYGLLDLRSAAGQRGEYGSVMVDIVRPPEGAVTPTPRPTPTATATFDPNPPTMVPTSTTVPTGAPTGEPTVWPTSDGTPFVPTAQLFLPRTVQSVP